MAIRCRIGYRNLFREGTLSASSEDDGYAAQNAVDWLTFDGWRPISTIGTHTLTVVLDSPAAADYIAIARHNLGTAEATLTLEALVGSVWTEIATVEPTDDRPYMVEFASVIASQWRVVITDAIARPQINILSVGALLKFPIGVYIGHSPGQLAPRNDYLNNSTEGGQFVGGRVISHGVNETIQIEYLPESFVLGEWRTFQRAHLTKPLAFFWAWDLDGHSDQVSLVWPTGNPQASYTHPSRMQVSVPVVGIEDGGALQETDDDVILVDDDEGFAFLDDDETMVLGV